MESKILYGINIENPYHLSDSNHQCLLDIGYRFGKKLDLDSDEYQALYRCYWIDSTLDEQLLAAKFFTNCEQTPKSDKISVQFSARDIGYYRITHPNVATIQSILKFYHKPGQTMCLWITKLSNYGTLIVKLKYLLKECKRLPNNEEILNWSSQIARGLAYLHANGIPHSNLRPTNILFFYNNQISGGFRLKITDYISSIAEINDTNEDNNLYKDPSFYPSNNQQLSEQSFDDKKADIWSLAVIIVELIIGSKKLNETYAKHEIKENLGKIYIKKVGNKTFDTQLIDLLEKMFENNQEKRLNAVQVCNHKWMSTEIARQRSETSSAIKIEDNNTANFIEIVDKLNEDKLVEDSDEELLHSPVSSLGSVFDSKDNYDSITEYSIIRKIAKK